MTDKGGKYGYRAVVPVAYAIPDDVSLSFFFLAFGVINSTSLHPGITIRARSVNSFWRSGDTTFVRVTCI